jgi:hypothetical protein
MELGWKHNRGMSNCLLLVKPEKGLQSKTFNLKQIEGKGALNNLFTGLAY